MAGAGGLLLAAWQVATLGRCDDGTAESSILLQMAGNRSRVPNLAVHEEGNRRATTAASLLAADSASAPLPGPESLQVYFGILGFVTLALLVFACRAEEGKGAVAKIESWTGFRWALALWIFLRHQRLHPVSGSGAFLLLSGAMLALSPRQVEGAKGYLKFLLRRFARIYPAYWLALSCCLLHRSTQLTSATPLSVLAALPLTDPRLFFALDGRGTGMWFIGTVLALYPLFPLISRGLARLGTCNSPKTCLAVMACCYSLQLATAAVGLSLGYGPGHSVLPVLGLHVHFYQSPLLRLPQFAMGVALGHMVQALGKDDAGPKVPAWVPDLAALLLPLLALTWSVLHLSSTAWAIAAVDFFLEAPIVVALMLGLATSSGPSYAQRFLSLTPIRVLGKWSYGVYLWSNFFRGLGQERFDSFSLFEMTASYSFCVAASAVSFIFLEEPVQNFVNAMCREARPERKEEEPPRASGGSSGGGGVGAAEEPAVVAK